MTGDGNQLEFLTLAERVLLSPFVSGCRSRELRQRVYIYE